MPTAKLVLISLLSAAAVLFAAGWWYFLRRRQSGIHTSIYFLGVGFITNFLDTLGIGSFATTTALFRFRRAVADENIPGTLNVGHCLPTVAQALIYLTLVEVEPWTLTCLILAAICGAWFGVGVVTRFRRRQIQIGMGIGLLIAAGFMVVKILDLFPGGGDALMLRGPQLVLATIGCALFGALMTIGIGAYAPIMIMISLFGMNPKAAFPIMMGSCAFLTCAGSLRFVAANKYDQSAALGLTIGGLPAVLCAAYLVTELPLSIVRLVVVGVVTYTSLTLLRAASTNREPLQANSAPAIS